ncbi:MAG: hypothetical protein K5986_04720 [Clostridium sp.]|nr:hypothetical protein [Clostridium sp.]
MEETKDSLKNILEEYFYRITYANDCFELHKFLIQSKAKYLNQMNISPAFFYLSYSSLFHTVVIELSKLFDPKSKTGLYDLLNVCRDNINLFPTKREIGYIDCDTDEYVVHKILSIDMNKELADCRKLLKNISKELENLRNWRNKFYAHLDEKYRNDKNNINLINDFPLNYGNINRILETAKKLCNKISDLLDRSANICQGSNVFDVESLFKQLSKCEAK